jgi:hypothetical protein
MVRSGTNSLVKPNTWGLELKVAGAVVLGFVDHLHGPITGSDRRFFWGSLEVRVAGRKVRNLHGVVVYSDHLM